MCSQEDQQTKRPLGRCDARKTALWNRGVDPERLFDTSGKELDLIEHLWSDGSFMGEGTADDVAKFCVVSGAHEEAMCEA